MPYEKKKNSQENIAHLLGFTKSQYSRRESGVTKITRKEWDIIVKFLNVPLEAIYEPEDGVYIISDKNNTAYFETMNRYIKKLEQENNTLKKQLGIQL